MGSKKQRGALEGRRRRRQVTLGALVAVVVLVAAAVVGLAVSGGFGIFGADSKAVAAAPPLVTAAPAVAPVPTTAPEPLPAGVTAALGPTLKNPGLGDFTGQISDALTGQVLWQQNPAKPQTPGSSAKLLTMTAALLTLPPESRVMTKVVQGAAPGQLVLVGGGDPTLTAQPTGKPGYYQDAPRISDLVAQIKRAGIPVNSIAVDTSLYAGAEMAAGWEEPDIAAGNITPIEPVMLDGGRSDPLVDESPRSTTPALDAGRALAQQLGLDPAAVRPGAAATGAAQVASVRSAPLTERMHQLMATSDNVLAETVGLEVAQARGEPMTFDGTVRAIGAALSSAGFDLAGLSLHDANGLSTGDLIPARLLDQVLVGAAGDSHPQLRALLDDLPIAGATGTLADRFADEPQSAGWTRAKTGTLSIASTLAGVVTDSDNRVLTFALMSNDSPPDQARPALDAVAGALRPCGCR